MKKPQMNSKNIPTEGAIGGIILDKD